MPRAGNVGQFKNCSNVVSVEEEEEEGVGSGCLSSAVLGVEIPELFFLVTAVFDVETSELFFLFEEGEELVDVATSGLFFIFVVCFSGAMP